MAAFGREGLIGKGNKGMFGVTENFCIQKEKNNNFVCGFPGDFNA